MPKLLLVADDAGFASTDRGIAELAKRTGLPICAEYMIEQDGAIARAHEMRKIPNVSLGLHFELSGISDAERVELSHHLAEKGQTIGQQPEYQKQAITDAKRQLEIFTTEFGRPAHISTHGNFHVDPEDRVMPWWEDLMQELFEADVPPLQMRYPLVRHDMYSWNTPAHKHPPLTPAEFAIALQKVQNEPIVEFVMHPALPEPDDASIEMLYSADMRIADLESAIIILQSGVIREQGCEIVSADFLGNMLSAR